MESTGGWPKILNCTERFLHAADEDAYGLWEHVRISALLSFIDDTAFPVFQKAHPAFRVGRRFCSEVAD